MRHFVVLSGWPLLFLIYSRPPSLFFLPHRMQSRAFAYAHVVWHKKINRRWRIRTSLRAYARSSHMCSYIHSRKLARNKTKQTLFLLYTHTYLLCSAKMWFTSWLGISGFFFVWKSLFCNFSSFPNWRFYRHCSWQEYLNMFPSFSESSRIHLKW